MNFLDYMYEREKGTANRKFEVTCTRAVENMFKSKIASIKTTDALDATNSDIQVQLKDGTAFQIECKNIHGDKGTQAGYGNKIKLKLLYVPADNVFQLKYLPTNKKHSFTADVVNDYVLTKLNSMLVSASHIYSSSVLSEIFQRKATVKDIYQFSVVPQQDKTQSYSSQIKIDDKSQTIILPADPSKFKQDDADDMLHFIADIDKDTRKFFQDLCLVGKDKANRDYTESELVDSDLTYEFIKYWYKHKSEHTTSGMPICYIIASDGEDSKYMYKFPFAEDYLGIGNQHDFTPECGRFTTQINLYTLKQNIGTKAEKTLVNKEGNVILYVRWKIMEPIGLKLKE